MICDIHDVKMFSICDMDLCPKCEDEYIASIRISPPPKHFLIKKYDETKHMVLLVAVSKLEYDQATEEERRV